LADVDALLLELLDRVQRGESREDALEALCREHADAADTLRRRVGILDDLGVLHEPPGDAPPERLGPFRLLGTLGAGGMGVVYRARDETLGREVALKVIRPEHLFFPGARERFRREVDAVARLQHPGIVPVYSVGETGGVPYFAMELVRGASLAAVLGTLRARGERPSRLCGHDLLGATDATSEDGTGWLFEGTWERACLRVIRQVADALEHAHGRGVVHRDLKPSNVMIAHGGGVSQAKLLDFGLARGRADASLTTSGSRVGSLAYMAPEQAWGEVTSPGPAVDVYGLGVTLYEMLTLRRAFDGDSDAGILLAIQRGEAPRPRAVDPGLGREAEAVCLTAMDVDPARRYASAADFARDVGNVLDRRPIEARRAGVLHRARRWVERHPAAAVALVLAIAGPLLLLWRERRSAEEIGRLLERSERNLARALEAIDRGLVRVADESLRYVPQVQPVRAGLLEDAVELTERLLEDAGGDRAARLAAAASHARLGGFFRELGRTDESLASLERAADLFDAVAAEDPGDTDVRRAAAAVHDSIAETLREVRRFADAERAHDAADARLAALLEADPGSRALRLLRARGWSHRAALRSDVAFNVEEATFAPVEEAVARAGALYEDVLDDVPDDVEAHLSLGKLLTQHVTVLLRQPPTYGPRPREQALMERALGHLERARALDPDDPEGVFALQTGRMNLASVLKRGEAWDAARDLVLEAVAPLQTLVDEQPATMRYRLELAAAYNQLGSIEDWRDDPAAARPWYERGVETMREVVRRAPHLHELQHKLAIAELNLGAVIQALGDEAGARPHLEAAVAHVREASRLYPEHVQYRRERLENLRWLARCCARLGDVAGTVDVAQRMVEAMPESGTSYAWAAVWTATALGIAREGGLPEAEVARLEAALVPRCVELLRAAAARDYDEMDELWEARELEPIRGTGAFEALLAEHAPGGRGAHDS